MLNAVAVFVKRIIDIEDRAARIAEYRINSLLDEYIHQNLRTVLYHADPPPFLS